MDLQKDPMLSHEEMEACFTLAKECVAVGLHWPGGISGSITFTQLERAESGNTGERGWGLDPILPVLLLLGVTSEEMTSSSLSSETLLACLLVSQGQGWDEETNHFSTRRENLHELHLCFWASSPSSLPLSSAC